MRTDQKRSLQRKQAAGWYQPLRYDNRVALLADSLAEKWLLQCIVSQYSKLNPPILQPIYNVFRPQIEELESQLVPWASHPGDRGHEQPLSDAIPGGDLEGWNGIGSFVSKGLKCAELLPRHPRHRAYV